jgi:hypothetical protein
MRVESARRNWEHFVAKYKLPGDEAPRRELLHRYKTGARIRKISFALTTQEFRALVFAKCHYCGVEPRQKCVASSRKEFVLYTGIDRVDNSKGYEAANCVPCCDICNKAKHTMSQSEFCAWIDRLVAHRQGS